MTREQLRDGYRTVMGELNDVKSFFDRADSLYHDKSFCFNKAQRAYWKSHPVRWAVEQAKVSVRCAVLYQRLMKQVKDPVLKAEYRKRLRAIWKIRREPAALFIYMLKCAIHFHYQQINSSLERTDRPLVNTF